MSTETEQIKSIGLGLVCKNLCQ